MVCCFGPDTEKHFDSEAFSHTNTVHAVLLTPTTNEDLSPKVGAAARCRELHTGPTGGS